MSKPTHPPSTPATARKTIAERTCDTINGHLGWAGARPVFERESGYTGGVILSTRAANEVATLVVDACRARAHAPRHVPTPEPDAMVAVVMSEDQARTVGAHLDTTRQRLGRPVLLADGDLPTYFVGTDQPSGRAPVLRQ